MIPRRCPGQETAWKPEFAALSPWWSMLGSPFVMHRLFGSALPYCLQRSLMWMTYYWKVFALYSWRHCWRYVNQSALGPRHWRHWW